MLLAEQIIVVRAISFDLLDDKEKKDALYDLNKLVCDNGYHLNTGFLSTPDLCEVLSQGGYNDTAYKLLLQKERPGWLYSVIKGAFGGDITFETETGKGTTFIVTLPIK